MRPKATGSLPGASRSKRWSVITAGAACLLAALVVLTPNLQDAANDRGRKLQTQLQTDYNVAINLLLTCKEVAASKAKPPANQKMVANIIVQGVAGKNTLGLPINDGDVYTMLNMSQSYPTTSALNAGFRNAMSVVHNCQDDFVAAQKRIDQSVREFRAWRKSFTGRFFGRKFPTSSLMIEINQPVKLTGVTALAKMSRNIIETDVPFETGANPDVKNDIPFYEGPPTPTPTN